MQLLDPVDNVQLRDPLAKAPADIRLTIVEDSFRMIRQRPLLGWGFGTFPVVYPSFRSFYTDLHGQRGAQ